METPGEPGDVAAGGVYAATLKPKKSLPKGRIKGAGTLTSDSRLLFETTFCLLNRGTVSVISLPARHQNELTQSG